MKRKLIILVATITFLAGAGLGTLQLSNARTFQFFGNLVHRVETEQKIVALTFDDGPTHYTEEILSLLAELDVQATFFVTGRELAENPEAGALIVDAGHELGNHSWSHQRMVFRSPEFIRDEIQRTNEQIRAAGHQGPIHFRPPNGKKLLLLPRYLRQENMLTIMWDQEPDSDPTVDADVITASVLDNVQPGSIILLHIMYDQRQQSRDALPGIITGLREKGYSFATVTELLNH